MKDYFLRAEDLSDFPPDFVISYFPPDFVTVSLRANSCLYTLNHYAISWEGSRKCKLPFFSHDLSLLQATCAKYIH